MLLPRSVLRHPAAAGAIVAARLLAFIKSRLALQQISPLVTCGADFAAFLRKRSDEFGRAIRDANLKAE
jgi:hypothetical protein